MCNGEELFTPNIREDNSRYNCTDSCVVCNLWHWKLAKIRLFGPEIEYCLSMYSYQWFELATELDRIMYYISMVGL